MSGGMKKVWKTGVRLPAMLWSNTLQAGDQEDRAQPVDIWQSVRSLPVEGPALAPFLAAARHYDAFVVHWRTSVGTRSHGPRRRGRAGGNCREAGSKGGRHSSEVRSGLAHCWQGVGISLPLPAHHAQALPAVLRAGREGAESHHWCSPRTSAGISAGRAVPARASSA